MDTVYPEDDSFNISEDNNATMGNSIQCHKETEINSLSRDCEMSDDVIDDCKDNNDDLTSKQLDESEDHNSCASGNELDADPYNSDSSNVTTTGSNQTYGDHPSPEQFYDPSEQPGFDSSASEFVDDHAVDMSDSFVNDNPNDSIQVLKVSDEKNFATGSTEPSFSNQLRDLNDDGCKVLQNSRSDGQQDSLAIPISDGTVSPLNAAVNTASGTSYCSLLKKVRKYKTSGSNYHKPTEDSNTLSSVWEIAEVPAVNDSLRSRSLSPSLLPLKNLKRQSDTFISKKAKRWCSENRNNSVDADDSNSDATKGSAIDANLTSLNSDLCTKSTNSHSSNFTASVGNSNSIVSKNDRIPPIVNYINCFGNDYLDDCSIEPRQLKKASSNNDSAGVSGPSHYKRSSEISSHDTFSKKESSEIRHDAALIEVVPTEEQKLTSQTEKDANDIIGGDVAVSPGNEKQQQSPPVLRLQRSGSSFSCKEITEEEKQYYRAKAVKENTEMAQFKHMEKLKLYQRKLKDTPESDLDKRSRYLKKIEKHSAELVKLQSSSDDLAGPSTSTSVVNVFLENNDDDVIVENDSSSKYSNKSFKWPKHSYRKKKGPANTEVVDLTAEIESDEDDEIKVIQHDKPVEVRCLFCRFVMIYYIWARKWSFPLSVKWPFKGEAHPTE